jgi:hypothetical protein
LGRKKQIGKKSKIGKNGQNWEKSALRRESLSLLHTARNIYCVACLSSNIFRREGRKK